MRQLPVPTWGICAHVLCLVFQGALLGVVAERVSCGMELDWLIVVIANLFILNAGTWIILDKVSR
jgi:hypothetical protein